MASTHPKGGGVGGSSAPGRMDRIDDDVLAAASDGEKAAFAELWRCRQAPLLRYLAAQRIDPAPVVARQVWIAVAGEIGGFGGDVASFDRWFFTIARRVCTTSLPPPVVDGSGVNTPDNAGVAALRGLAPPLAEVVVLRLLAELSSEDVAAITGRTEFDVDRLLTEGLTELVQLATPDGVEVR